MATNRRLPNSFEIFTTDSAWYTFPWGRHDHDVGHDQSCFRSTMVIIASLIYAFLNALPPCESRLLPIPPDKPDKIVIQKGHKTSGIFEAVSGPKNAWWVGNIKGEKEPYTRVVRAGLP